MIRGVHSSHPYSDLHDYGQALFAVFFYSPPEECKILLWFNSVGTVYPRVVMRLILFILSLLLKRKK